MGTLQTPGGQGSRQTTDPPRESFQLFTPDATPTVLGLFCASLPGGRWGCRKALSGPYHLVSQRTETHTADTLPLLFSAWAFTSQH